MGLKFFPLIMTFLLTACVSHTKTTLTCASLEGLSAAPKGLQTCKKAYSSGHNPETGQIAWVHYRLSPQNTIVSPSIYPLERSNELSRDPRLPSGFDLASLVPPSLHAFDRETFGQSRDPLILVPMHQHLHRYMEFFGDWAVSNMWEGSHALRRPETEVFSGPIYERGAEIPSQFYKIYYDRRTLSMLAMIFENDDRIDDARLAHNVVTVDCVEERTGLNFFEGVPHENDLENDNAISVRYWNMIDGNSWRNGCK